MEGRKLGCIFIMFIFITFFFSSGLWAKRYKLFNGKADYYSTGWFKETAQFGVNEPDYNDYYQLNGCTDSLQMLRSSLYWENQLKWSNWDFRATFRYEADLADSFHDESGEWDQGSGQAWDRYSDAQDIDADQEIDDIVREANIGYFSPYFSFRAGKQQLGWGEADGIRYMDRIHGLDMRKSFILRDSDEGYSQSRVPLWMIKTDFTPTYNFGSSLGLQGLDLEVTWIPDADCHNRFAIGPRQGGPWGWPLPDLPLPLKQLNLSEDYPEHGLNDSSYAVRLKGTFLGTFFTLNYYNGWAKNFVFDKDGDTVGFITDPNFHGNVADGKGLSLDLEKDLNRQRFFGFTASRELPNVCMPVARALGQYTLPVIRVEALYELDQKFNYGATGEGQGNLNSNWIWDADQKERDYYKYLVGLDWNLHCDMINPNDDIWLSMQFAQNQMNGDNEVDEKTKSHMGIPGGDDQQLTKAPYDWPVKEVETFTTLLLKTKYWNQDLIPQILWVKDWAYHSDWIKAKLRYEPGDHWRYEVGTFVIDGNEEKQFGLFKHNDAIYTSVSYQF